MNGNSNAGSLSKVYGSQSLLLKSADDAKQYILALITTMKLTEKEIRALEEEAAKWKNRVELARSGGKDELLSEAEKEAERINQKLAGLREEEKEIEKEIEGIRRQLPGIAARERSIDPDLLEQELLMALGRTEEEEKTDREFRQLEKENAAGAALEALKSKMKETKGSVP